MSIIDCLGKKRNVKRPEIKEYIKLDPSELSNAEIMIGYKKYSKAMVKYADHLEQINSSNPIIEGEKVIAKDK